MGMHLICHLQRLAGRAIDLPAVFIELVDGADPSALARLQALEAACKFTNQVASRNPCGQGQLLVLIRTLNAQHHMKQVGVRIRRSNGEMNGRLLLIHGQSPSCSDAWPYRRQ